MSHLGKISLYLNLALASFFAVWGFGLYSNRMDWKAESKDRSDQLRKMGGEISKLVPLVETTRLLAPEQDLRRPVLDKWYASQLEALRSGKDKPKALVYRSGALSYDDRSKLPQLGEVLNAANQPISGLASLDVLDQQYAEVHRQLAQLTEQENKMLAEERQLTVLINGEGGAPKGMRGELADRLTAQKKSLERQEYLMPLLYNRQAELEILNKRKQGLDARLKELQGSGTATPQ